jgi:hypothetical protein
MTTAECRPKSRGWRVREVYCEVHGRSAGWPCTAPKPRAIESRTLHGIPNVFTGKDSTYGEQLAMARAIRDKDWNTPTERGLAISLITVIEDFASTLESED